ncbi:MAG TPA: SRPBCC domain-containing protein [Candidatus Thermoplasmatota archaeon]|nr:SRPBCC domain-containing protein [Candidatus Thermoplasmatota archaeon]
MAAEIRQEHELPFPIERVWRALTNASEMSQWMSMSDIKPVVGHRFRLIDRSNPHWDGVITCEVVAVEAPRRLVYTWSTAGFGPHEVEWTLQPTATGTRVRLRHSGFAPDWVMHAMVARGYETLFQLLRAFLESGKPQREAYTPTPAQLGGA